VEILFRRQDSPIGNINDSETAMHDGKMRRPGCIFADFACETYQTKVENRLKINIFLTRLSKTGNRMVAQAKLLANSVIVALIIITTRMMTVSGAPTIK